MFKFNFHKLIKIGIILLVLLFLLAMIIILVNGSKNKTKNNVKFENDFTLLQPLMKPEFDSLPDDYYLNRPKNYKWSEKDVERWFSNPDDELLDELHEANDKMILDILEAAP